MVRPPPLVYLTMIASCLILVPTYFILRDSFDTQAIHTAKWAPGSVSVSRGGAVGANAILFDEAMLKGETIMPKLGNATAKAELGRASWKLLHTMAARFPENPTSSEREAFKSFLYLFSRLYPCGECAAEFQALLKKHPPQTSSRSAASFHLCHLHNLVNLRLGKPEFDCSKNLEGIYDCGCGSDEEEGTGLSRKGAVDLEKKEQKDLEEGDKEEQEDGVRRDPQTGLELVGG
ncbi:flavin-linked sulfhydryl oxidase [Sporobolomyces salmoneus]|uniref:flavin-linked sulfhydryl oxidase n=1 Tax=Sporobolomyces salmoneus TaxID=183962 RepID=UPI0031748B86